jgi:imidazolonepropionase-like amidohydrolase
LKALFVFLFSFSLFAKDIIYLKPKAFLDVEKGEMVYGKIIGIKNDKIVYVGKSVPKGSRVDNENVFLLPGFFDCHTHVFFIELLGEHSFEGALVRELKISEKERVSRAKKFLHQYLNKGFTSVCDLGNSGNFLDAKVRNEIAHDSAYPQMFVSGPGIAVNKAQFAADATLEMAKKEYTIVDERTDMKAVIKKYADHNVDILKIYLDNSPGAGEMSADILKKIISSEIPSHVKKITFHVLDRSSVKELEDLPVLNIEHGNSLDCQTVKNQSVYMTLTDLPEKMLNEFGYYHKVSYLAQLARAKAADENKATLVFGTDFYFQKPLPEFDRGEYAIRSVDAWKEAGISPLKTLQAMTINAAKSLHEEKKLGVIKVGATANLVGASSNPLENLDTIKNLSFVMNKGKRIK